LTKVFLVWNDRTYLVTGDNFLQMIML